MKIAIMGYGTIGSGVKEVLDMNRAQIEKKGGENIEIKYILARKEHIPGVEDALVTTDFSVIENDPEVELVVESIGGIHPAYEYIKSCLEKGKHVVSSNKAVVDASISLVGISHLAHRMVHTLSDGERQKSMIARTLAQQTPIILLDEPTAFLDFPSSVEVFRLLRRLAHEEQKTILMTCHDIQLALRMADCIWLFDETLSVHQPPLSAAVLRSFLGDEATDILLSQSI